MGKIVGRFITPHPPLLIPAIGRGEEQKVTATAEGMRRIAGEIAELKPTTILVISPHAPCFSDHFYLNEFKRVSGDFSAFGAKKILFGFDTNLELTHAIIESARNEGLPAGYPGDRTLRRHNLHVDLDHGILVPLSFVCQQYSDFKLVPVSIGGFSPAEHYRYGRAIAQAVATQTEDVVVIASGDCSHKLCEKGPYSFAPEGPIFDQTLRELLANGDGLGLLDFDPRLRERAAQCGLDGFTILLGTLDSSNFHADIFSYEGPFGVGYLTASLHETSASECSLLDTYLQQNEQKLAQKRADEHPYCALARRAIDYALCHGGAMETPTDVEPELLNRSGGAFVSLHKYGALRGCIGTTSATQENLAREIIVNAVSAATRDPRFHPVTRPELDELTISVDILNPMEEVRDESELDPKRYGVFVRHGAKQALLLPDLDGIDTVKEQLSAVRDKAGINPWSIAQTFRFTVTRYE